MRGIISETRVKLWIKAFGSIFGITSRVMYGLALEIRFSFYLRFRTLPSENGFTAHQKSVGPDASFRVCVWVLSHSQRSGLGSDY